MGKQLRNILRDIKYTITLKHVATIHSKIYKGYFTLCSNTFQSLVNLVIEEGFGFKTLL